MSIKSIMDLITNFFHSSIVSKFLEHSYKIFIFVILASVLYFIWYMAKQYVYAYVMDQYNYKIKIVIRDDTLFIYFTPFLMYPKLINYKRIRSLGVKMAKVKAPKVYNKLKYIYTINTSDLSIYKESDMNT